MKRLICAKDVEALVLSGDKIFQVDGTEIITPAAKELAKLNGIIFTTETPAPRKEQSQKKSSIPSIEDMDGEMMLRLFKAMMDKGLLEEMLKCLKGKDKPFEMECEENGFKVIRGNTVRMDVLDTGNKNDNVKFQELVNDEDSKMSAGFLTIEESVFSWEVAIQEVYYIIEGTLTIEINGKTYEAYEGDVLFMPTGSNVVLGAKDKVKVFYSTRPIS